MIFLLPATSPLMDRTISSRVAPGVKTASYPIALRRTVSSGGKTPPITKTTPSVSRSFRAASISGPPRVRWAPPRELTPITSTSSWIAV